LYYENKLLQGTFVHGILDNDEFRTKYLQKINSSYEGFSFSEYKRRTINTFVNEMKNNLDVEFIKKCITK